MSMSEFEGSQDTDPDDHDLLPAEYDLFPADFSLEDVEFARELNSLFSAEQEEMPPFFVQTLMDADNPRFQPLEGGLEFKTRAQVFRRLKLKRCLFQTRNSPLQGALSSRSRPLYTLALSCLLVVAISIALTIPTFASGLRYLWTGAHSGVLQVSTFPPLFSTQRKSSSAQGTSASTNSSSSSTVHQNATASNTMGRELSIGTAQSMLNFKMAVPFYLPSKYQQHDYYLYDGDPGWADGPIMVLDYTHALPGVAASHITICEFKPQGKVLQVAQDKAAHQLRIQHGDSDSSIVYVEGQWSPLDNSYVWDYSNRSQVIFELNGVEIWIVGDKRDGIGQHQLLEIADSLTTYSPSYSRSLSQLDRVLQTDENTLSVFAGDVIYLDNPNNPDGPSFKLIGTPSSPPARTDLNVTASHVN